MDLLSFLLNLVFTPVFMSKQLSCFTDPPPNFVTMVTVDNSNKPKTSVVISKRHSVLGR